MPSVSRPNQNSPPRQQLSLDLAIRHAPIIIRRHGVQEVHAFPLVSRGYPFWATKRVRPIPPGADGRSWNSTATRRGQPSLSSGGDVTGLVPGGNRGARPPERARMIIQRYAIKTPRRHPRASRSGESPSSTAASSSGSTGVRPGCVSGTMGCRAASRLVTLSWWSIDGAVDRKTEDTGTDR